MTTSSQHLQIASSISGKRANMGIMGTPNQAKAKGQ
jgi:hypothetical protein